MSTRSLMIHPSTLAVLPAPATVHSLAVLPARATTIPFPASVTLTVLPQCSKQFPWSDLLLPEVCSDMRASFFGSTPQVSFCVDGPIAEQLVPAASLGARRTSCCISVSSISRRLPVAFVTGVGASFDPSFSLHSLVMSSTCMLFDFHSDSCRLHRHFSARVVFSRHLSIEPHRFDSWHDLCVEMCRPNAFERRYKTATRGKIDSTVHNHAPMVLRDESRRDANNQLTHQDVLDISPTLVCLVSVPCRHVPPDNTCCAVSFLLR